MTRRALAERQVTDVVIPDDRSGEMLGTVADTAIALQKKSDMAKMNQFAAQAQLDLGKITNDWRVANQGDPGNADATAKLAASYDSVLNQYDGQIGYLSKGQWIGIKNKIKGSLMQDTQDWAFKQGFKNAEQNINSAIKLNLQQAEEFGARGDWKGGMTHRDDALSGLKSFGIGVLGETDREKLLADFKSDYMKTFLTGMAKTDPGETIRALDNEHVKIDIGNLADRKIIFNIAEKQKKVAAIKQKNVRIDNELSVVNALAEGKLDYADVASVSDLGAKGLIRPEFAQAYIRYLTSPDSIKISEDGDDDSPDKGLSAYLEGVYKSGSKQEINDVVRNALNGGADGKVSGDDLARIIRVAGMRSQAMQSVDRKNGVKPGSDQSKVDALYQSVVEWTKKAEFSDKERSRVLADWADGMTSDQAADPAGWTTKVMKRAIAEKYPVASMLDDVPNMAFDKTGPVRAIFPKSTTVYPARIYDPKTGGFAVNQNREISSQEKK